LTEQLRPQDKVTIITYASGEKLILEPTSGDQKDKILTVINELQASGATAGEQAIQLAYKQAEKAFVKNGINRILLATDGDFNVGITDFSTLKGMVAEKRKSGISLTTLGFGQEIMSS
jgi:Ca-activated chloride channel family protein